MGSAKDLTKLKVNLKLTVNRLRMLQSKKSSINQQQRRQIATLLESGKEESARVRVKICQIFLLFYGSFFTVDGI